MAQYKVITLSVHCDKVRRVFESGDIITDDQLHEGQGPKLVADGFLQLCGISNKYKLTQEDIDLFPEMSAERGVKVGDEVELFPDDLPDEEKEQHWKAFYAARAEAIAAKEAPAVLSEEGGLPAEQSGISTEGDGAAAGDGTQSEEEKTDAPVTGETATAPVTAAPAAAKKSATAKTKK